MNDLTKHLSDQDLRAFRSSMAGAFYQTWDLDEEGGMVAIIDRQFGHSPEAATATIRNIDKLLRLVPEAPEIKEFLECFTGDYDPSYDGMQVVEWLVLLKKYLEKNRFLGKRLPQLLESHCSYSG